MLSKFKKLFRASRNLSPQKDSKDLKEKDLHSSQEDKGKNDSKDKKKESKEKGKRKTSQPNDVGDVVETQNQDAYFEEMEIVENEYAENGDNIEYP